MSFIPTAIQPLSVRVRSLKYPENKWKITFLSLEDKQAWIAAQEPQKMIDLGIDTEFVDFWNRIYIIPLKIKRWIFCKEQGRKQNV